ncbi:MAG: tetratricopeptide repeat protein, partial [Marinosulfonomonas sp.]
LFGAATDPERGVPVLEQLALAGDENAKFKLADAYRTGTGTAADPARSIALFEGLAEAGNTNAYLRLGDFYARGTGVAADKPRAIDYYRAALEAGNSYAGILLGRILAGTGDGEAALDAYTQALDSGQAAAALEIAAGHAAGLFGAATDPERGVPVLEQLALAGDENAALKILRMLEKEPELSVELDEILKVVHVASLFGNGNATAALVRFYRLQPELVENALEQRAGLLEGRGVQMTAAQFVDESLHLTHETLSPPASYLQILSILQAAPAPSYPNGLLRILRLDQNAYVFVLQVHLKELGYYQAEPNGQLTSATIRSIAAFCANKDISTTCALGPMRGNAARAIGLALVDVGG